MNAAQTASATWDLDALPPAVARPVQWRRLREQLEILRDGDPAKGVDAAYAVADAIGGMSDERLLRRMLATEAGRALVQSRVSLPDRLADHDGLRRLPAGSLGRAFLAFSERNDLNARKLVETHHVMSRDYARLDPVRQWASDRFTVMHDLLHVVAGYDTTILGESALMGFFLAQRFNDRALPIFILMSLLTGRIGARDTFVSIRRGWRAAQLASQPWEALLDQPLEAVRARLGVDPPEHAHPRTQGLLIPAVA
jgi:ubiquinone biosynthesis protein COQ4